MSAKKAPHIPLPKSWTSHVRSAMLHVISLAQFATVYTRSWAIDSLNGRVRLKAENDRLRQEVALFQEEIRIKDARMGQVNPHGRPHYPPTERMAILELRAARGWLLQRAADTFLLTAPTIASWMKRVDEEGSACLGRAIRRANTAPKYIVCDRDSIFDYVAFRRWETRGGIKPPRYGAVSKHGSIAVVERLIRTIKEECTRRILVPLPRDAFRREILSYVDWYNEHRPHTTLAGRSATGVQLTMNDLCTKIAPTWAFNDLSRKNTTKRWRNRFGQCS